jgi:hypothetical protein
MLMVHASRDPVGCPGAGKTNGAGLHHTHFALRRGTSSFFNPKSTTTTSPSLSSLGCVEFSLQFDFDRSLCYHAVLPLKSLSGPAKDV